MIGLIGSNGKFSEHWVILLLGPWLREVSAPSIFVCRIAFHGREERRTFALQLPRLALSPFSAVGMLLGGKPHSPADDQALTKFESSAL